MNRRWVFLVLVALLGLFGAMMTPGCGSSGASSGFGPGSDGGPTETSTSPSIGNTKQDSGNQIIGAGCGGGSAKTAKTPVFYEFVVDGSGSMNDGRKRPAQEAALKAVFEQIHKDSVVNGKVVDTSQGAGMIYFGIGTYPGPSDVFVRFVDQAQLAALVARVDMFPSGTTPSKEALTGGYSVLDNLIPAAPLPPKGKKVVIFMSDGVPDNATGIVQMVQQKTQQADPIATFSVGVGELTGSALDYDPKFMSDIAVAGGTALPNCDPSATNPSKFCHFQITPGSKPVAQVAQEFIDALNAIRQVTSVCDIDIELIDKDGKVADPSKVNVKFVDAANEEVDIKNIPRDPNNGWTYDDDAHPTRVILHGTYCDEARSNKALKVKVLLGCQQGG